MLVRPSVYAADRAMDKLDTSTTRRLEEVFLNLTEAIDLQTAMQGGLHRPLTITIFDNRAATRKRVVKASLFEFATEISKSRADTKADLPWLKLPSFGNKRS